MAITLPIQIPQPQLTEFCQRHHVRKLSLFGLVLRDDFRLTERRTTAEHSQLNRETASEKQQPHQV